MFVIPSLLFAITVQATELIWMYPPTNADRDRVAIQAGATGPALNAIDVRSAATAWNDTDNTVWRDLEATLQDVRAFETKLDGERVIMRDLMLPISRITMVRDESDRNKLFAALAYQGFAVNRFFDATLADDPEAEPYRMFLEGDAIEKPWFNAVALDPKREITPYDIAEAPQRVQYKEVAALLTSALPASLTPEGLPESATLFVDGRAAAVGPAGNLRVVAGRHLVHVSLQGAVIARWDIHADVGASVTLAVELTDEVWRGFLDSLTDGGATPTALLPQLEALGGEIWIAQQGEKVPVVFAVSADGIKSITIERPKAEKPGDGTGRLHATVAVGGGWFYSGDFLLQNPDPLLANKRTVNAISTRLHLGGEYHMGSLVMIAGVDTDLPLGELHVANTGGNDVRFRPYPYVGFGLPLLQVNLGYVLPYHPAVGVSAVLPLSGPVILRASGRYGLPGTLSYDDKANSTYDTATWISVGASVGIRL